MDGSIGTLGSTKSFVVEMRMVRWMHEVTKKDGLKQTSI